MNAGSLETPASGARPRANAGAAPTILDLDRIGVREANRRLHDCARGSGARAWRIVNPKGRHCIAVGLDAMVEVTIAGPAGYYCAGMNQQASIEVEGQCGKGVGENMMSGTVRVRGDASEAAGATGRGGLLVVEGDASGRCGISMKGVDIVVGGSVGHFSAFMAQTGHLVICGDAEEGLGDSIYEAIIYLRGQAAGLGADCVEKEMTPADRATLAKLLARARIDARPADFRRYGSARELYHFHADHVGSY